VSPGEVLFEYEQRPLPPPIVADHQVFRRVEVAGGSFSDWFALHDVHVYRFALPG
jgi:NADPH:quinone reductase-like Zn-dependent oxidoreductase